MQVRAIVDMVICVAITLFSSAPKDRGKIAHELSMLKEVKELKVLNSTRLGDV